MVCGTTLDAAGRGEKFWDVPITSAWQQPPSPHFLPPSGVILQGPMPGKGVDGDAAFWVTPPSQQIPVTRGCRGTWPSTRSCWRWGQGQVPAPCSAPTAPACRAVMPMRSCASAPGDRWDWQGCHGSPPPLLSPFHALLGPFPPQPAPEQLLHLSCSYETNSSPYLLLQPAKKEMVQIQPYVALYHDFITDAEAETIKGLAGPWVSHPCLQRCPFPAEGCPRRS